MLDGMLDSVKGCLKEEMRMDTISNNLANSGVIGFKKNKISFQSLFNQAQNNMMQNSLRVIGSYDSDVVRVFIDMAQGDMRMSGNPLDFAIDGQGFFKIMTPDGIRYTRKGNFSLDNAGILITQEGYKVMGKGGPISLNGKDIQVDGQGIILVDGGQTGQFDIVTFLRPEELIKEGGTLFSATEQQREMTAAEESKVLQGYTEISNVNIAEEMVQMIQCVRAFESYQKSIQIIDGINSRAINEVSKLR